MATATKSEVEARVPDAMPVPKPDPSKVPAQQSLDTATEREQAHIAANERRRELRESGKTSAEVNAIEQKEIDKARKAR